MKDQKAFDEFTTDWADFEARYDEFRERWSIAEEHGDQRYLQDRLTWLADWMGEFESDLSMMGWKISLGCYGREDK